MSGFILRRFLLVLTGLFMVGVAAAAGFDNYATLAKQWEAAYNKGDADAITGMYAVKGTRMPPNAAKVQGQPAIRDHVKELMEQAPTIVLVMDGHEVSGNIGYAMGRYTLKDAEGKLVDRGSWIQVGKRSGGHWYTEADIWNSDLPLDH